MIADTVFMESTGMFIGHIIEQAPSALQVVSERLMENTRKRFVIPKTAPYGQAYLHHGRSMKTESTSVAHQNCEALQATSVLQKLNSAKYGSYVSKINVPLVAVTYSTQAKISITCIAQNVIELSRGQNGCIGV